MAEQPKISLDEAISDLTLLGNALRGARRIREVLEHAKGVETQLAGKKAEKEKELAGLTAEISKKQAGLDALTKAHAETARVHQDFIAHIEQEKVRAKADTARELAGLKEQVATLQSQMATVEHDFADRRASLRAEQERLQKAVDELVMMKKNLKSQLSQVG